MMMKRKYLRMYIIFVVLSAILLYFFVYFVSRDPYDSYAKAQVVSMDTVIRDAPLLPDAVQYQIQFYTEKGEKVVYVYRPRLYIEPKFRQGQIFTLNYDSYNPRHIHFIVPGEFKSNLSFAAIMWLVVCGFLGLAFYIAGKRSRSAY